MKYTNYQQSKVLNRKVIHKIFSWPLDTSLEESESTKSTRVLICLPFEEAHFYSALKVFLPFIRQQPELVRLMVPQAFFPLIQEINPDLLIPLITSRINKEGFPTDPEVLVLARINLNVAIDLNVIPTVTTAFIVSRCRAPIKVGFQSELSEKLFNLIINYKTDRSVEKAYNLIWHLVQPEIYKINENLT
ncbi:MAG TPA: hypothetical protein P5268_05115 [Candidatus Marinimicrobia bacterium]|nr:hypothetical protein [Candidatus Neomarinimicrobiota bacterium]HRU92396.1 hypothetical protein [Candidatus Neomarinimicrobiota bacterium]